jgi:hypothetical protein
MINVTKQMLSDVCPAQMKLMLNRCRLLQRPAQL